MSCKNHGRSAMKAVLILLLLLVISGPLGAQFDLTPGQGGNKEHVSWKIALEPAKLAPGERGEIVASYETTKGWYLYAPDHGASTGLPARNLFKGNFPGP